MHSCYTVVNYLYLESVKQGFLSLTIFIASINVTLNSLRILAWLFNFLLQACFGGAALSKSNYRVTNQQNQHKRKLKVNLKQNLQ